ncbi:MAG: ATP-binding protein [Bryobacterales bacterium]|nr:ATP-binding protein [Bryobacterales bacterium]
MLARENPFATHRLEALRYRWPRVTVASLTSRFEAMGARAALVGPKGTGKTALLREIGHELVRRGWRIREVRGGRKLPPPEPGCCLLIDGAERIDWPRWLAWRLRYRGAMLITAHRGGRLPLLHRCESDPGILRDLARELGVEIAPAESERLFLDHAGNLRDALLALYTTYASKNGSPGLRYL